MLALPRPARRPIPKQVHGHTVLEISWTVAFALILLIIGIPTIRVIFRTQEAAAATALDVDVGGQQWWWEFRYPRSKIVTANEVHLPVGQTVAFRLHGPRRDPLASGSRSSAASATWSRTA